MQAELGTICFAKQHPCISMHSLTMFSLSNVVLPLTVLWYVPWPLSQCQLLLLTVSCIMQRQLVINSLQEGVVSLIRDLNGNHVIQRCLQRLGPEDSQFVYNAACAHTMEIATHRHGCCVLQRCIDFATPVQKKLLVAEIAANALPLSQVTSPSPSLMCLLVVFCDPVRCT